jgi:hypothetical protein
MLMSVTGNILVFQNSRGTVSFTKMENINCMAEV